MKRIIAIILILFQMGLPVIAQEVYEGIAVQGREGEFPVKGYYAASDRFARGSVVEVRNPSSGAAINVIIVGGVSDQGIFMILSPEAADALGVTQSNAISIVASPVSVAGLTSVDSGKDLPFSSDPETNPGAEFTDPNQFVYNPGSEIPEVDNPLLQPRSTETGTVAEERTDSASTQAPETTIPDNSEPKEIADGEGIVILEQLTTPELESLFAQQDQAAADAGPAAEESSAPEPEFPVTAAETATEAAAAETPADEITTAPSPAEVASGPVQQQAVPAEQAPATHAAADRRSGLLQGLGEILDDGIGGDQPVTGASAYRGIEPPPVYSYGILSALSSLKGGGTPVSPDFTLGESESDHEYWPEEYNADNYAAPADEVAAAPDESLPVQEAPAAGDGSATDLPEVQPEVQPDTGTADEQIALTDPSAETPSEQASAGTTSDEYASALDSDPAQAWIDRIKERYPDRELFLPPVGTDLEGPLPSMAGTDSKAPDVTLSEVDNPLAIEGKPEQPLDGMKAAAESTVDSSVPEIGFDLGSDLPSASIQPPPQPAAGRTAIGSLPLPDTSGNVNQVSEIAAVPEQEPTVENGGMSLNAPSEDIPDGKTIPLVQYLDPRPSAGFPLASAAPSDMAGIDSQPLPREQTLGIEAGILRISAAEPGVSDENPPEPGDRSGETSAEVAATPADRTTVDQISETEEPGEPVLDQPLGEVNPDNVDVTLEPADYRSPSLITPEDGIGTATPEDESIPDGFVMYGPGEINPLASKPAEEPAAEVDQGEPVLDQPLAEARAENTDITMESSEYSSPDLQTPEEEAAAAAPVDGSDLLVYLEQSENRSPAAQPEAESVATPATTTATTVPVITTPAFPDIKWAEANLPLVYNLQPEGYYLQVGAFSNPRSAKQVVEEVAPGYPLAVLPVDADSRQIYRVFVGPLTEDEKGMVLYWFRARGYKDAFIRKGL